MFTKTSKYLLLLSVSALPCSVQAQDAGDVTEVEDQAHYGTRIKREMPEPITIADLRIQPITVTANGLGTDIGNTGQSVTIIDKDEIDAVQGADLTRVLNRVPGVTFSRNGGAGGFTGVTIRGSSSEQVLVLVDGVRVSDPASPGGGFDFGNVLTGTAGKLDILRGSNSTIWGSDAVGGVIDISTRGTTGLAGSVEYGARDTLFASATAGLDQDGYYLGLTSSWYQTDGFSAAADGEEADGFDQFAVGATGFVDLTDSLEAFAHINFSEGDLDIDGFSFVAPYGLIDTDDRQETTRIWGDVGLAYYGNDLTLRASYAVSDTERTNLAGDGSVSFASEGDIQRLAVRGEYRLVGGLAVAFGGEHEASSFDTTFDDPAETSTTGVYTQLAWVMGDLAAHVGVRFDDPEDFGSEVSFGGDVSYRLGDNWRLRASVGEGYKAPTLYQLFSDFGNGALAPESSTSFDLGVEQGDRLGGLHFALTAFRRDSENLIGFASCFATTPPAICDDGRFGYYDNTGRARAQGIEFEMGYYLTDTLRLSGLYSLIDTEDRDSGNALARRPKHSGAIFAEWESDFGLTLGGDLRIVGESYDDAGNFTRIDGYEVFDIRASMDVSDELEIFGRVENLFDKDYQTAAGYGTPGRGAFVGVRARM